MTILEIPVEDCNVGVGGNVIPVTLTHSREIAHTIEELLNAVNLDSVDTENCFLYLQE